MHFSTVVVLYMGQTAAVDTDHDSHISACIRYVRTRAMAKADVKIVQIP